MKKRILSMILVLAMLLTLAPATMAKESGFAPVQTPAETTDGAVGLAQVPEQEQTSGFATGASDFEVLEKYENGSEDRFSLKEEANKPQATDVVTFMVEMDQQPQLEKFSAEDIAANTASVQAYGDKQAQKLDALKADVTTLLSDSESFKMGYTYTLARTGFSVTTEYGNKAAIEALPGVVNVYVAPVFEVPVTAGTSATDEQVLSPMTSNSSTMIGADVLNASGYTGKGQVIAILDTGLVLDHPNFQAMDESKITEDSLTKEKIEEIWEETNAFAANPMRFEYYRNNKVPFYFNYYYGNGDVSHDTAGSDHGTHVAGIAAANKVEGSNVMGMAPDAQLVVMQVFSNNGAGWDTINAALEDCVRLGVDTINLSLGAAGGFTEGNASMQAVMESFENTGMEVLIAAGNDTHNGYGNNYGQNMSLASNPDVGLTGTPSTFPQAISIASVDNDGAQQLYFTVGDLQVGFTDSASSDATKFIVNFANETLQFVPVPGYGEAADYADVDVTGKVALVSRGGGVSFPDKQAAAQAAGAIACVVYNNVPGSALLMQINDGGDNIPCVSIALSHAQAMIEQYEAGVSTMTVCGGDLIEIKLDRTMSDFSTWGTTPDLKLKPELSGVGGSILSTRDPDMAGSNYGEMSGTSMATPQVAGAMAVLLQYLKENTDLEGKELRLAAANIALSTADPVMYSELEYSPRNQGAGLINLVRATTTKAYLSNPASFEERAKAEMGDDPDRTGAFAFTFEVHNTGSEAVSYTVDSSLITEALYAGMFMSHTPAALEAKIQVFSGETEVTEITVPAGETLSFNAKIQLTADDMAYLNESFENGMYVEGYLYLRAPEGGVTLNMPVMGFYGDWSDAPVFDAENEEDASLYGRYIFTNMSQLGANPYIRGGKAGEEYNAFSYANPFAELDVGLLRGAKYLEFIVTNADTGEVYWTLSGSEIAKSYYSASYGMVIPFYVYNGQGVEEVWTGYDAEGNTLPDGTRIKYTVNAYVDDGDMEIDDVWEFEATMDNEYPQVVNSENLQDALQIDKQSGKIELTLSLLDNEYIAALLFLNANGDIIGKHEVDNVPGEVYTATYDITGYGNNFSVLVADFACNETEAEVLLDLGDMAGVKPQMKQLDKNRLYGCEIAVLSSVAQGWFSGNIENGMADLHNEVADTSVVYYSAEYVNGYIIAQRADNGNIDLITPYNTYWDSMTLVEQNAEITEPGSFVLYDMALDHSGQTPADNGGYWYCQNTDILYAVGWDYEERENGENGRNMLYRFKVWSYGEVEVESFAEITGTRTGAEILTLGCTTDGQLYGIDQEGDLHKINKFTGEAEYVATTSFVNEPDYMGVNVIQSMTYDHNTGKMYWAAHSQNSMGTFVTVLSYIYELDLETGECTVVGEWGDSGATSLFVPNDLESDFLTFGGDPTSVSISDYEMSLLEGRTALLEVNWSPWWSDPQPVTWSSDNESVVTVTNMGLVTAHKPGTATITATTTYWDQWAGDYIPELGRNEGAWVETTMRCQIEVIESESELYVYNIVDYKNLANNQSWLTFSDKSPKKVTNLGQQYYMTEDQEGNPVEELALWQGGTYYNGYVYTVQYEGWTEANDRGYTIMYSGTALYRSKIGNQTILAYDFNDDGEITTADARVLLTHINGGKKISEASRLEYVDVNGDGYEDVDDVNVILAYCAGLPVDVDMTAGTVADQKSIYDLELIGRTSGIEIACIAFDYNSGRMYGVDMTNGGLAILDLETGSVDPLGTYNGDLNPSQTPAMTVAINPMTNESVIIVADMDGNLYTVDPDTMNCRRIGSAGAEFWYYGGMGYDYNTGSIYWTPCNNSGQSPLYMVRLVEEWGELSAKIVDLGDISTNAGTEATVIFAIPENEPETKFIHTESIEITNGETATGLVGGTLQLNTATVPTRPTVNAKTWTSDNPEVASVDRFGKITYNAVGTATITVSTQNKGDNTDIHTDSITVTVLEATGTMESFMANDSYGGSAYYDFWLTLKDYAITEGSIGVSTINTYTLRTAEYYDGYWYGFNELGAFFRINNDDRLNYVKLGQCNLPYEGDIDNNYSGADQVTDMAIDYTTGIMYGLTYSGYLCTINMDTGYVTMIGEGLGQKLYALACTMDGTLYAVGSPSLYGTAALYTVNKETGAADQNLGEIEGCIVHTGKAYYGTPQYNSQMTYDATLNRLYLNATASEQTHHSSSGFFMIQLDEEGLVEASYNLGNAAVKFERGSHKIGNMYLGALADIPEADEIPVGPVNGIILNKTSARVAAGETLTLTGEIRPSNAVEKGITWTSSDDTVATVDANGVVTGVKDGTVTITATSVERGNVTATCVVTVITPLANPAKAYTVSADLNALVTFNPELPGSTVEVVKEFHGAGNVRGINVVGTTMYYAEINTGYFPMLWAYDLTTHQKTAMGYLYVYTDIIADMTYDPVNEYFYVTEGFYIFKFDPKYMEPNAVNWSVAQIDTTWYDSSYTTLGGVQYIDGYVYYTGSGYQGNTMFRVEDSLDPYTIEFDLFDIEVQTDAKNIEMDYDATLGRFYITDADNQLHSFTFAENPDYDEYEWGSRKYVGSFVAIDVVGDHIDVNGLSIIPGSN